MKRSDKEIYLNNIISVLSLNDFIILVNFKYMTASDLLNLRNAIQSIDGGFFVVKNSLARIAITQVNKFDCLLDSFVDSTAIIYSHDMAKATKILVNFIDNNHKKISIICAAYSNKLLTKNDIIALAKLPSLDEMRIKIMRLILNVPVRLALSLNLPVTRMLRALNFYSSK